MSSNSKSSQPVTTDYKDYGTVSFNTICNLCSVGCAINLTFEQNEIVGIKGAKGLINDNGKICDQPLYGYKAVTKGNRITTPLLRKNGRLEPVDWDEAFNILHDKVVNGDPREKAFFAGARLTNEEQYLVMKLSRACAYSNNIGSFHYLGRGTGYTKLSRANIPFAELTEAGKIYIIGSEVESDIPMADYFIFNNQQELKIPVEFVTVNPQSKLIGKADKHLIIKSYFHFIKAVNHYIVSHELEDKVYINNLVENFEDYKKTLLLLNISDLQLASGVSSEIIEKFALEYLYEPKAVVVFSENNLSGHTCGEIFNLAILTGKHGRTGAGLMLLKENNNSHGLHDIGVMWNLGPGATPWDDPFQRSTIQFQWHSKDLPVGKGCTFHKLNDSGYTSLFIFGEDPLGCATDPNQVKSMLAKSSFIMVQDYTLTETTKMADLVLPASFPYETGGTFTNCQRVIQKVDKRTISPLAYDSWKQLEELLVLSGYDRFETIDDVTLELAGLLPKFCTSSKLLFKMYDNDNFNPLFNAGADYIRYTAEKSGLKF